MRITTYALGSTSGGGDLTYIKYRVSDAPVFDYDILIDAGANSSDKSIHAMNDALGQIVDGTLDFFIVTHGDSDHTANADMVFDWVMDSCDVADKNFQENSLREDGTPLFRHIGRLIDFDMRKAPSLSMDPIRETALMKMLNANGYLTSGKRERALDHNHIFRINTKPYEKTDPVPTVKYTPAPSMCFVGDGVNNRFPLLGELEEDLDAPVLTVLNNYYYNHSIDKNVSPYISDAYPASSSDVTPAEANVISVPICLTVNGKNLVFTGDLEEFDSNGGKYNRVFGETKLIELNPILTKNPTLLYKAGHHGAETSSSSILLNALKPEYIFIDSLASEKSGNRYGFPKDIPLQNMTKWTDKIYITEEWDDKKNLTVDYAGDCTMTIKGSKVSVSTSNSLYNSGRYSIFDTEWFKNHRNYQATINFFAPKDGNSGYCTMAKLGHIEVLFNAGLNGSDYKSTPFTERIESFVNDGVLDCLVVSGIYPEFVSELVGKTTKEGESPNGLLPRIMLGLSSIKKIGAIVYPAFSLGSSADLVNRFNDLVLGLINRGIVSEECVYGSLNDDSKDRLIKSLPSSTGETPEDKYTQINFTEDCCLRVLKSGTDTTIPHATDLVTTFNVRRGYIAKDKPAGDYVTYLNLGCPSDGKMMTNAYQMNKEFLDKKVDYFEVPNHGQFTTKGGESSSAAQVFRVVKNVSKVGIKEPNVFDMYPVINGYQARCDSHGSWYVPNASGGWLDSGGTYGNPLIGNTAITEYFASEKKVSNPETCENASKPLVNGDLYGSILLGFANKNTQIGYRTSLKKWEDTGHYFNYQRSQDDPLRVVPVSESLRSVHNRNEDFAWDYNSFSSAGRLTGSWK